MSDTYNGWKNKETWLVNLWLGDVLDADKEEGAVITPEHIEALVDQMMYRFEDESGFVRDMMNCALGEIDYAELASHYEEDE
mgnify:FL=1